MARRNDARRLTRRDDLLITCVVTVVYALATFLQEKFTACNGFGHDGCAYGTWALDFPKYAIENKLGSYGIQRALPSLIAWAALKALHVQPTAATVVRAFELMNVTMIFIAALAWTKVARLLELRAHATLFGAVGIFATYGVLKFTTWYPVLGDLWGFAFGFVFLYAYLSRRAWLIAPCTLLGAFAWPSLIAAAVPLLFFGRHRGEATTTPRRAHLYVAGGLALAWMVFTLHTLRRGYWPTSLVAVDTMPQVVRLSVLIAVGYCFVAAQEILKFGDFFRPALYYRAALTPEGALAVVVPIAIKYLQAKWSVPEPMGFEEWISSAALLTTLKPGISLLAYVVYFGPLVLIAILRWPQVIARMRPHGAGVLVAAALMVLFGLDSEERHGYTFLALVLPFVVKFLDDLDLDLPTLGKLALACVLCSKIWLTLPPDLPGAAADFPAQTVFMSQGPWMSNLMYLVQLPIAVLLGFWIHGTLRRAEAGVQASTSRAAHAGDVELGVARQDSIRALPRDADDLRSAQHVAVLGAQGSQ